MPNTSGQASDQIQELSGQVSALTANMSMLQFQVAELTSQISR